MGGLMIGLVLVLAALLKIQGATFYVRIGRYGIRWNIIAIKPVRERMARDGNKSI